MRTFRISLITFLLIALACVADGQSQPKPVLVDEYSYRPACDDFLGRLDGFLSELRDHPESTGVIVLRNTPSERSLGATLSAIIEAWMDFRTFNRGRIEIVRADADEASRQFWRIPPGAPKPSVERLVSGFQMSDLVTEPFLLADESRVHICPEIDDLRIFAGFLRDNPTARGNIVVRDRSASMARKNATRILKKLASTYGISRRRLRVFVTNPQKPSDHEEPIVEYWYLP